MLTPKSHQQRVKLPCARISPAHRSRTGLRVHSIKACITQQLQPGKLCTGPFIAARWTLVLLNMFRSSWSDFYTLAMEPLLTDVATDPELVSGIRSTATSTKGVTMFLVILVIKRFLLVLGRWWSRFCRLCLSHLLLKNRTPGTVNSWLHIFKNTCERRQRGIQTLLHLFHLKFKNISNILNSG